MIVALMGADSPRAIAVRHLGERTPFTSEIHCPFVSSISMTSYIANQLGEMYGDDMNGDVWPIRKEG